MFIFLFFLSIIRFQDACSDHMQVQGLAVVALGAVIVVLALSRELFSGVNARDWV